MFRGSKAAFTISLFVAISAVGGAVALILGAAGPVPLEHTPFETALFPGVVLAVMVGGTSSVSAVLVARRSTFAIDAMLLAGGTLVIWIVAELAMLRATSWLQLVYGGLGVILLALAVRASWRAGRPRHRWVIAVTAAETLGYLAPVTAGVLSTALGLDGPTRVLVLGGAGFVEGFALGIGQSSMLPVSRVRYAVLTGIGAAIVWTGVMSMMALGSLPGPIMVVVGVLFAGLALIAIGGAQFLELRRSGQARSWSAWTALAWMLALPLSFAPGPFVDASTPLAANLALWACGGMVMAYAMAQITWFGVRSLDRARLASSGG